MLLPFGGDVKKPPGINMSNVPTCHRISLLPVPTSRDRVFMFTLTGVIYASFYRCLVGYSITLLIASHDPLSTRAPQPETLNPKP